MTPTQPPPGRRGLLGTRDWALSMAISQRARAEENNEGLRGLLVHRLDGAAKAIWRLALGSPNTSVYCEPCREWHRVRGEWPVTWSCPTCQRDYEVEFAVYTEIMDEPEGLDEHARDFAARDTSDDQDPAGEHAGGSGDGPR